MIRIRIFLLLAVTTVLLIVRQPALIFTFLLLITFFSFLTVPYHKFMARLKPLLFISFFIIIFQLIFNLSVSPLDRFLLGINAVAKILAISLSVFYFTTTTSLGEIIGALSFLPSSARLALTVTFSLIPAVIEEGRQISIVQSSRGLKKSIRNPLAAVIPVIIPLIHRVLSRAEKISLALYTKGYGK